jgi:O-methyltransferase
MLKRAVTVALARRGWELQRRPEPGRLADSHPDLEPEFEELLARCSEATMTSVERMYALYQAVRYVHAAGIPGDIVECGVWRGGSSMLAALTLDRLGDRSRRLWLYDTFEGMSEPTDMDVDAITGDRMTEGWHARREADDPVVCLADLDDVRSNMESTKYPMDRVELVQGKVEDTIPERAPETISLLRLDTDWFESTRHELEHLWPRLQPGGVLIIDDYGHWVGARNAVDEYLARVAPVLLHRIDYTGRIAIKPS